MSPKALVAEVAALSSHYSYPDMDDEVRLRAQAHWVRTLGGLPAWAVRQAIADHVRTSERRPSPASLHKRVVDLCAPYSREIERRRDLADYRMEPLSNAERAKRKAVVERARKRAAAKRAVE
jgi:hypothetical protein